MLPGCWANQNDLEFVIFVIKVSPVFVPTSPPPKTDLFSRHFSGSPCLARMDSYNPGFSSLEWTLKKEPLYGTERWSHLVKVTQLFGAEARIQT